MTAETVAGPSARPATRPRIVQLDGVRGVTALIVVLIHLDLLSHVNMYSVVITFLPISGFLITRGLLRQKRELSERRVTLGRALKEFYLRRALRVLPLAYLCTLLMAVFFEDVRRALAWHLGYLSNMYFLVHQETQGMNWILGHFWSLAIEEQFYLLWPWVVLLLPMRALRWAFLLMFPFAIATRALAANWHSLEAALYLMPCNLDSFAAGGVLALAEVEAATERWRPWLTRIGLWFGFPLYVVCVIVRGVNEHALPWLRVLAEPTAVALFTAWLIHHCVQGKRDTLGKILESAPADYVGLRSYSLYVWHPVLIIAVSMLGLELPVYVALAGIIVLIFLVTVVSYRLIEVNGQKLSAHLLRPKRTAASAAN